MLSSLICLEFEIGCPFDLNQAPAMRAIMKTTYAIELKTILFFHYSMLLIVVSLHIYYFASEYLFGQLQCRLYAVESLDDT